MAFNGIEGVKGDNELIRLIDEATHLLREAKSLRLGNHNALTLAAENVSGFSQTVSPPANALPAKKPAKACAQGADSPGKTSM